MKILTTQEAEKIAQSIFSKLEPDDSREFLLIHSEKVGKVAKIIAQELKVGADVFEIAGWIHDIGYSKSFENHANYSIPILNEMGYDLDEKLEDCILNHGNGKNPKTTEGKIFQLADKLSIFDVDTIENMIKNGSFPIKDDDINFLKMMSENALKLAKNFSK